MMVLKFLRPSDYYFKALPMGVRQQLYKLMNEINPVILKDILEKPQNYPSFRRIRYTDEHIAMTLEETSRKFKAVNDYLAEHGRYPMYTDPDDAYQGALEHLDLLKMKSDEELLEQFGCSFSDYPIRYLRNRSIDYYIKGFSEDEIKEIVERVFRIYEGLPYEARKDVDRLLHRQGQDAELKEQLKEHLQKSFMYHPVMDVDHYLKDRARPPFFSDPRDAYQAALEYIELTRVKTAEELLAEFGCTWDEYVPVSVG